MGIDLNILVQAGEGNTVGVRPSCMNSRMNSAGRPHLPPSGEIFTSSWAWFMYSSHLRTRRAMTMSLLVLVSAKNKGKERQGTSAEVQFSFVEI